MSVMKTDYASYLRDRGRVSLLMRRIFLLPIKRYFHGKVLDCYPDAIGIDREYATASYCHAGGVRCIQADAHLLPFLNDSFDGVLLNNVLEHLERPEDALSEIRRVLKKGGILVYSTCSLEKEENEDVIDMAINELGVELIEMNLDIGEPGLSDTTSITRRIWPDKSMTQGFFVAKMIKE